MRILRLTALALALPVALAACADSPAAPEPTPVDALNALADSLGAADPLAGFIRAGALVASRVPTTSAVSISVDGVSQTFHAFAMETVTPSTIAGDQLDVRALFAFDDRMQRFVQVNVISSRSAGTTAYSGVTAMYGERAARGQPPLLFAGAGTATGTRARTGSACPTRPGDSQIVASCVEAGFDFAFAFDARPMDLALLDLGALQGGSGPVAHTLRMGSSRVPGALLTLKDFPSLAAAAAAAGR